MRIKSSSLCKVNRLTSFAEESSGIVKLLCIFSAISSENHRNKDFEHTLCHVDRGTYGIGKCDKFINTQQMSEKNLI